VAYRSLEGRLPSPDLELVDAAALIRVGDTEAMIALNEAALAWRTGDDALAAALALRARRAWMNMGELSGGALLAATLALASGAEEDDAGLLVERALACPDAELGLQALGLVALSGRGPRIDEHHAAGLAARLTRDLPGRRYEVLSAREALEAIRARWGRSAAPSAR
jgi:hypothetical protein